VLTLTGDQPLFWNILEGGKNRKKVLFWHSMDPLYEVQPLSYKSRQRTFFFLLTLFVVSLPFLYLYATGYRFDLSDTNALVGTGGIYVAAERTGAQIFIDNELVRETRVFRTAFYAQNLEPKTHRVHVQKEGHHTWVKELPVTSHRVTEAQAFNLPLVPDIRVISEWVSATGSAVVRTPLPYASTTNEIIMATTTKATSTYIANPEYVSVLQHFVATTTVTETKPLIKRVQEEIVGTTTTPSTEATSTIVNGGVRLARAADQHVYAEWIGSFDAMPYYYCAKPFPRYSTTTDSLSIQNVPIDLDQSATLVKAPEDEADPEFVHPVQEIEEDLPCDRRIEMGAPSAITAFDFFPGSSDLVLLELADGIYVSEIDNRAWQNRQPLIQGANLHMHVENGSIYVYDGTLIYQVVLES
jgi:hypothetical protein